MAVRLRLLVVDDEEAMRDTLRAALSKLGHLAEVVSSGEEALEALDSGRFDLVITDLYLGGMNGDQLARMVKRQDGETPVILLTAYPPAQTPDGVDQVLIKPFNVETLRDVLQRARGSVSA